MSCYVRICYIAARPYPDNLFFPVCMVRPLILYAVDIDKNPGGAVDGGEKVFPHDLHDILLELLFRAGMHIFRAVLNDLTLDLLFCPDQVFLIGYTGKNELRLLDQPAGLFVQQKGDDDDAAFGEVFPLAHYVRGHFADTFAILSTLLSCAGAVLPKSERAAGVEVTCSSF